MFLIFINPSFYLILLIFINILEINLISFILTKLIHLGLHSLGNEFALGRFLFADHVFIELERRMGLGYLFLVLVNFFS